MVHKRLHAFHEFRTALARAEKDSFDKLPRWAVALEAALTFYFEQKRKSEEPSQAA
jgi:hypothetical protein